MDLLVLVQGLQALAARSMLPQLLYCVIIALAYRGEDDR